jgi:hypothetical protein
MAEQDEIAEPEGSGDRVPGESAPGESVPGESAAPKLSRRRFLRAAAGGGVAIGLASVGIWGAEAGWLPPFARTFAPSPSPSKAPAKPSRVVHYRSRPDLRSPMISVTTPGLLAGPGLVCLTPAAGPGALLVDNSGAAVWIHPTPSGKREYNLRAGSYKGKPVLTWWEGTLAPGIGFGEYVLVDESYREVARVRAGNGLEGGDLHEFITTPEGTGLFSAYDTRSTTPSSPGTAQVLDSIVQEVDIATGRLLFEWRASDHVSLDESYVQPPIGQPFDYFHINSIDVEPDGNLLISARNTCALYKIDRRSGEVIWRLGGKRSDYTMGPGTEFSSLRITPAG